MIFSFTLLLIITKSFFKLLFNIIYQKLKFFKIFFKKIFNFNYVMIIILNLLKIKNNI